MGGVNPPEVINIPDVEVEEEQDCTESGPMNPAEAKLYVDHITDVFDTVRFTSQRWKKCAA